MPMIRPPAWWWPTRHSLHADLLAGLLGAVLVLPQGIAFATLAGLPPQYGLYSAVVPCIVAALAGSSHHVVSGPTNANSLALFAMLAPLAAVGSPAYVEVALAVTVLVGLLQFAIGALRLESTVLVGSALSLGLYLHRTSRPALRTMGFDRDRDDAHRPFVVVSHTPGALPECPQLKLLRMEGSVYFGATAHVADRLQALRDAPAPQRHLLVMAKSMNFVDLAGAELWRQELRARRAIGGDLYFHRPRPGVLAQWRRDGFLDELGTDHVFPDKRRAIAAITRRLDRDACARCTARVFEECTAPRAHSGGARSGAHNRPASPTGQDESQPTGDPSMIKPVIAAAALVACAGTASAQVGVSVFGLVDAYVESARISGQATVNRVSSGGSAASRWGLRGSEDLGGGLAANFVIENGFAPDTGTALQGGRLFGRQAWVGLASATAGEIRLGRQYAPMHYSMQSSDIDAFSAFSPVFAMYLSNGEQSRHDNQVSYWTPRLGGFSGAVSVAAGEGAAVAPGPATGWIPAAGTARRSLGALLRYQVGALNASAGFHQGGQTLAAGEAEQRSFNLGATYRFGSAQVGGNFWEHRNELPTAATARSRGFALGVRAPVAGALSVIAQVGQVRDNGRAYATGVVKPDGRTTHVNVGANYTLSKRTELYLRYARIEDRDAGYNGRATVALFAAFGANNALPIGGSARSVGVGLRHSF